MRSTHSFWKIFLALFVSSAAVGLTAGALIVGFSLADSSVPVIIALFLLIEIFAAIMTGILLRKYLISSLGKLQIFAESILSGKPENAPDNAELAPVIETLDRFVNRIKESDAELEKSSGKLRVLNSEMERIIAERTDELQKANELLEEQIREKQVIEKILYSNEERYYLAAQATSDVIYEHNLVPKNTPVDENGEPINRSSNYKESPDIKWLCERIHPDDSERVMKKLDEVFAQGTKFWTEEYRFCQFDDSYGHILDRGYIIYDENFHPTRMIGAMSDFTERKLAEDALRESEERYRELIENANDIIYTVDLDGRFTSLNNAGQKSLGYNIEEARLKSIHSIVPPEHQTIIQKMMRQGAKGSPRTEFEVDFINSEGERLTLEVSSRIIFQDAKPIGIQGIARNISERKWAENQLRFNALHDSLTGLPNRTLLLNQLRQAIARKHRNPEFKFAVLFLDVDRFKVINDSLGHLIGDKLLIAVSETLKSCVRSIDTVSRLGGDEFVLLLEDVGSLSDAVNVAQRILDSMAQPFLLDGNDIYATTSIGITFSETGYKLPEEILRDADTAMYRAKSLGKNCYQIFDQEMFISAANLLKTETDLRRALDRDELELHYQPIVSLTDGKIIEVEALLRWNHPTEGMVSPADFVPIAEDTGLILPIGNWVIEKACEQLKEWQMLPGGEDLLMSVNLSPKQIARPELASFIESTLDRFSIPPKALNLEITESAIMENAKPAEALLIKLKKIGVWLTTDDFGTGYSSLSYLHRFPIDRLKIDRSFVWNMTSYSKNSEIVRTILMLARSLRMDVVAEGIETREQFLMLQELECHFGQGYLFSPPVNAQEAANFIKDRFLFAEIENLRSLTAEVLDAEYSH